MSEIGDEENSEEWRKIQNFVGQRQPKRKDPIQQIAERERRFDRDRSPSQIPPHIQDFVNGKLYPRGISPHVDSFVRSKLQNFDEGGPVQDPLLSDPDTMRLLEPPGAGVIAPSSATPPPTAPVATPKMPVPIRSASTTPPVRPPATFPSAPAAPAPSMTDTDYENEASKILGGITPGKIAELTQKTMKPTGGQLAGMGLAGIGDAIASVGNRNPGAMKNVQEEINQQREAGLKLPERMAAAGKERWELGQKLQENAQESPVAKYARETYGPLAKKLGLDISKASPKFIADLVGKSVEQMKAEAQLAYEQGTREDAKVGQIAGRYNKPINDIQKNIDDLGSSIKGLQSGDLGQIASAQAIVSQALKLSPRLAHEAGGQSYAAKLNEWASGKFGNQSMPPELIRPVMNVLGRQKQTYEMQRNNLVEQATKEGAAMRVNPGKIRAMFGTPGQPTSLGSGGTPPTINSQAEYNALPSGAPYIDSNGRTARKK